MYFTLRPVIPLHMFLSANGWSCSWVIMSIGHMFTSNTSWSVCNDLIFLFCYKVLYLFCRAKRTKSKTSWLVPMPTLWKTAPKRTCTRRWQRHWMKPGENSTWNSNTAQCCWTWASDSTRVLKMWVVFVHQHYVVRIVWGDYPNYELKNI